MGLKVGDVVRLKSGGPAMTITAVSEGKVWCTWFHVTDAKQGHFPEAAVELDDPGE